MPTAPLVPPPPGSARPPDTAHRVARLLAVLALVIGAAVLVGWAIGPAWIATLGVSGPPMVANTALMSALAGLALWLRVPDARPRWRTLAGYGTALAVCAVATLTLGEYLLSLEASVFDLVLVPTQEHPWVVRYPGRPSPHTAAAFLLLGVALLVLDTRRERLLRPAEVLVLASVALPFVALLGYVFDVEALYGVPGLLPYTGMALHTAIVLLALNGGVLAARPRQGLMAVVTSPAPGGVAARRLLAGLGALLPLALLIDLGAGLGLYTAPISASLIVLATFAALVAFVLSTALRLNRTAEAARAGEESRARLAALVESTDDAVLAMTPDTTVVHWNPAAERIFGYRAEDIVGRSIFTAVPEDETERSRAVVERILQGERVRDFETTRRRPDGTLVPISLTTSPIVDASGAVIGISSIARDISARRAADAALLEAHARERTLRRELARVLEAGGAVANALTELPENSMRNVLTVIALQAQALTGAALVAVGVGGTRERSFEHWIYLGIDEATAQAIGHVPRARGVLGVAALEGQVVRTDDLRHHPAFEGLPEHHPDLTSVLAMPVFFRNRAIGNLYLANKRDGAPFTDADERVVGLLASRAGAAIETARLYESENLQRVWLQAVFDQMPEGVLIVDGDAHVTLANHTAQRFADADAGEGLRFCAPTGEPLPGDAQPVARVLEHGEELVGLELALRDADGELMPVLVSATRVSTGQGSGSAVVVFQDVRALKELERMREEWASVIAHDLRQPIAAIHMTVQLLARLRREPLAEAEARALDHIADASRKLSRMVDDLLDVSRIEARRLALERREVDVSAVVARCVDEMRAQCSSEHALQLRSEPRLTAWVDPDRISQVLCNLLSNAAKYGEPHTPIVVALRGQGSTLELSVTNHGPGIPAEELPGLFSRFARTREARSGQQPGVGLGLYICRGLVEAHGGHISAESTPGETTTFRVVLPRYGASDARHGHAPAAAP